MTSRRRRSTIELESALLRRRRGRQRAQADSGAEPQVLLAAPALCANFGSTHGIHHFYLPARSTCDSSPLRRPIG
jgi:hypothetical protein